MTLATDIARKLMRDCHNLQQANGLLDMIRGEISQILAHPIATPNYQNKLRDLHWELDDAIAKRSRLYVELTDRYSDPEFRKQMMLLKMQDPSAYYWERLADFI